MQIERKGEWMELTLPDQWAGFSIETILRDVWKVPKKMVHQFRMNKLVTINGETVSWLKELQAGEKLQVRFFTKDAYGVIPNYFDLDVLYEDDHLLIVNKPAGMDTHPNEPNQEGTLANAVAYHYLSNGIETKVRHIHRLDKETTGAVIFAKHAVAGAILDRLLEQRAIKRTYMALLHGKLKKQAGIIDEPIGRDRHHATRRRVSPKGQAAVTHYEVINYEKQDDTTLVKVQLQTGRTHQIRVHMSYIGHPLVGDTLYGGSSSLPRQALHATKIVLPHPITAQQIECFAPPLDEPPIFEYDMMNI
ncbi:RluA family pseudouridine synthase [Bacillus solimangrovi]|uniref:Pseudouridine synthase n=1 Tax=Bacillus solimangrovi TaxID=1305675 RepID=A0A1E5LJV8_9BACI|nr:RluA family pseudouridine synthase [Bacillus solimangrovi]OEH94308.1 RNA pseudouridine synthase [Bacillus solimangrovi]